MFHDDIHEKLKDTKKIPTTGEGQRMQSMDEQPLRPTKDEQINREQPAQEAAEDQAMTNFQGADSEQTVQNVSENQSERPAEYSRGASEQIPLYYPPTQAPSQPGDVVPPPGGPTWNYPPRPEQYQSQVAHSPEASVTRPFAAPPGANTFGQPYPPATPAVLPSTEPVAQPGAPMSLPVQPKRSGIRTGALIALASLLALVFAVGLFAGWQFGRSGGGVLSPSSANTFQPGNGSNVTVPQLTGNNADVVREAVINKVQAGIVQINVTSPGQKALGSGVIIDRRGYIVTNNHVVSNASAIKVTLANGTVLPGSVVGTDSADDMAVIKVTPPASGLTTVNLGDSSKLVVGQGVLAIGSPLGNTDTVTSGIVSALNRNISESDNGPVLPDAIQTDAPINPGNSGGALVDMQGNLVGMPTLNAIDTEFNTPANGLGFAIPVNRIHFIAQQIINDGHVSHTGRSILGVTVTSVDQTVAAQNHLNVNNGALIVNVSSGGPAAAAGLQASDVIVQLDNKTVNSTGDLSAALLPHKPGDTVAVKVYRGSQQLTVNVSLGELPVS